MNVHNVRHHPRALHRMAGLTYMEVLIASALIAATLVPAIDALRPGIQGMGLHEAQTQRHFELTARLEEGLARPFSELDVEAQTIDDPTVASLAYSDPAGQANRRLVYLSRYDADNADGNDDFFDDGKDEGLLWVRVEIEGTDQALETLTSVYE